ncbi:matrix metalloproteinase-19-like [Topomyia yanbarensis]|uniref:matrix metalloproteinase-19-like n=1 Tax=Topomyia yanbarensis TaxID=2498891 RepID=UPI00273B8A17|nr:matrix metalloproteinase-19-like [Topomyia yanbarensis]
MMLLVILVLFGISERYYCAPFYIDPDTIIKPEHVQRDDLERGDEVTAPVDPRPPPEISDQEAQEVLNEIGFLDGMNSSYDVLTRLDHTKDDAVATALRKFQRRYQLPESGLLDDDTKRLLAAPRCGLAELNTVQDRWTKQLLTYRIRSFPKSFEPAIARQLIRSAFEQWSKHTNLNIVEVSGTTADIYVSDEPAVHRDRLGQECIFQRNTTLAHAFFPEVGDIHYNRDRSYSEEEFLSASMHEIGHSLGLDHTTSRSSIMFPMHIRYHTEIPEEDREALQALYGVRRIFKQGVPFATAKKTPSLCSLNKIDTILNDHTGQTFIFAGEHYFALGERNPEGRLISSKWPRLPANIDAAFTCRNKKTFFFKGSKLWVYADHQLEAGYPKLIADELPGLPNHLDAVYVTKGGSILAIRKKQYWFYNPTKRPQVSAHFPRLIYDFRNMPTNMDAALFHTDGIVYFFKNREYFTMDMVNFTVSAGSPLIDKWFKC